MKGMIIGNKESLLGEENNNGNIFDNTWYDSILINNNTQLKKKSQVVKPIIICTAWLIQACVI